MDFLIAVKECLPSLDMQGIRFHFMNDSLYQKIILYGDSDIKFCSEKHSNLDFS